ncbi:methylisocitrate lyase, partial [Pseudomonas aeruginosa]|nr:methylisocitrate lyase [Pseudomonas aeruginosa]
MSQTSLTPGQRFREAVATEHPLQVVGTINANHALLAKRAGFKAIYLSGGGGAARCQGRAGPGLSGHAPLGTP